VINRKEYFDMRLSILNLQLVINEVRQTYREYTSNAFDHKHRLGNLPHTPSKADQNGG